jgi:hypothetical protein
MRVAVETREHCGRKVPRRLRLKHGEATVVELLDQWFGSDYRYCKVRGSDGAIYILRVNEPHTEWRLAFFASPRAQAGIPLSDWARPHRTRM